MCKFVNFLNTRLHTASKFSAHLFGDLLIAFADISVPRAIKRYFFLFFILPFTSTYARVQDRASFVTTVLVYSSFSLVCFHFGSFQLPCELVCICMCVSLSLRSCIGVACVSMFTRALSCRGASHLFRVPPTTTNTRACSSICAAEVRAC